MARKGTFIVLEGGDGAGKDTQVELLERDFSGRGDIVFTRDPGGTSTAHSIRKLVLAEYEEPLVAKAELLLFLSARAQLVEALIAPALLSGEHVICQRYGLSTIAYQLYGREHLVYRDMFEIIHAFATENLSPDLYILLDVDPEVGMKRTKSRKEGVRDRFEKEQIDFHKRVCDAYQTEIVTHPHVIVDANRSVEEVYRDVKSSVDRALGE